MWTTLTCFGLAPWHVSPLSRTGLAPRACAQRAHTLDLMLCCCHLEMFKFGARGPTFSFSTGPHEFYSHSSLVNRDDNRFTSGFAVSDECIIVDKAPSVCLRG